MRSRLGTLFAFVVLLCATMSGAATPQAAAAPTGGQPTREQVLQLMSAMGIQESINESLHQAQIRVKDAARESFMKQNPQATDAATQKKLDEVFESTPFFKFEDVAAVLIPIYQKNLSAADVQAGIDFYNSAAGKHLIAKVPEIMRQANEQGGKMVQEKMDAYGEAIEKKLQTLQTEVRAHQPQAAASGEKASAPEGKSPQTKPSEMKPSQKKSK